MQASNSTIRNKSNQSPQKPRQQLKEIKATTHRPSKTEPPPITVKKNAHRR